MADQTPEEKAAAEEKKAAEEREAAIKRMEGSVPTPTQEENDNAVLGKVPETKAAEAEFPAARYQTRTVKPRESD